MSASEQTWICQQCGNMFKGQTINGICSTCAQTRALLAHQVQRDAAARQQADAALEEQKRAAIEARLTAARAEAQTRTYAESARWIADVERKVRELRREAPSALGLQQLLIQRDKLALVDAADVEPVQRVSLAALDDTIAEVLAAYTRALGPDAERATELYAARREQGRLERAASEADQALVKHVDGALKLLGDASDRGLDVSALLAHLRSLRGAPVGAGELEDATHAEFQGALDALLRDAAWHDAAKLGEAAPPAVADVLAATAAYRAEHGAARGSLSAYRLGDAGDGWVTTLLDALRPETRALLEPTLRSMHARVVDAVEASADLERLVVPTTETPLGTMQAISDRRGENGVNGPQVWGKIWETGKQRAATPTGTLAAARALQEAVELANAGRVPGWSGGIGYGLLFASLVPGLLIAETPLRDISGLVIIGLWGGVGRGIYLRWRWLNDVAANVHAVDTYVRKLHARTINLKLDALTLQSTLAGLRLASHFASERRRAHEAVAAASRAVEAAAARVGEA